MRRLILLLCISFVAVGHADTSYYSDVFNAFEKSFVFNEFAYFGISNSPAVTVLSPEKAANNFSEKFIENTYFANTNPIIFCEHIITVADLMPIGMDLENTNLLISYQQNINLWGLIDYAGNYVIIGGSDNLDSLDSIITENNRRY